MIFIQIPKRPLNKTLWIWIKKNRHTKNDTNFNIQWEIHVLNGLRYGLYVYEYVSCMFYANVTTEYIQYISMYLNIALLRSSIA